MSFREDIKEVKSGERIKASVLAGNARIQKAMLLDVEPPLELEETPFGSHLKLDIPVPVWVKITEAAVSGVYSGNVMSPNFSGGSRVLYAVKAKVAT